jgi:glycosyltransferase involved in cell wall biosynthesis
MRRLRVVLVTGAYAPEISSGGLQAQMVARTLDGRVDFRVLTTATDAALARQAVVEGVPVSRIAVDVTSNRSKLQAADAMTRDLVGLLRTADVVHLQGFSQKNVLVTAIAKLLRVPIVLSLQTAGFDEPQVVARQGALARWAFAASNLYLGVSPGLVEACRAAGVPADKVRYVPNGVDLERFHPATAEEAAAQRRSLGIDASRPVILFVGFFSRDKQPHVLFDAWLRLQRQPAFESTLLFVGASRSAYFEVDDRIAADMRAAAGRAGMDERLVFVPKTTRADDDSRTAELVVVP